MDHNSLAVRADDNPNLLETHRPIYIYLIHFAAALSHAQHYIGATHNLPLRLKRHISGNGSKLIAAVNEAGIEWQIAKVWFGSFETETLAKLQHNGPRYCPICNAKTRRVKTGIAIDLPLIESITPIHSHQLRNHTWNPPKATTEKPS